MKGPQEMLAYFREHAIVRTRRHAHYTRTSHSNVEFNFRNLFSHPARMRAVAREIALVFSRVPIDIVVSAGQGSGKGMYALSHYIAADISESAKVADIRPLTELSGQQASFGYQEMIRGARVLIVLDLFDHDATISGMVKGVHSAKGVIVGAATLVNVGKRRLTDSLSPDVKTRNLMFTDDFVSWELPNCKACRAGIEMGGPMPEEEQR